MRTVQELASELSRHPAMRGVSSAVRQRCGEALDDLDDSPLPLDERSWSQLERFLQARAQVLDPSAIDDYQRAIGLIGELLGVTGHHFDPSLRTGESMAVADTCVEHASVPQVLSRPPVQTTNVLDFTAVAPQLEVRWNLAGWAEIAWHGFAAGDDLTDALRAAWRAVRFHDGRSLLLDLTGATLLSDRDAQWIHDWLTVLQRDPLCRVALLGERGLLQRIYPRRAQEIGRVTCFLHMRSARQWLTEAPLSTTPDHRVAGDVDPESDLPAQAWRRRPTRGRGSLPALDASPCPASTAAAVPRARRPLMRPSNRSDDSSR